VIGTISQIRLTAIRGWARAGLHEGILLDLYPTGPEVSIASLALPLGCAAGDP
jgi:hypothetical protein